MLRTIETFHRSAMDTDMGKVHPAATDFYDMVVGPTVAEFLRRPDDQRLACLACLCLSALAEHYVRATEKAEKARQAIKELREKSRYENWAVGQVNDIANAVKHVVRKDSRVGYQDVSTQEIRLGLFRCGWPINGTEVMIEVEPDHVWLVSDLVEAADFWWRTKLGIVTPIST